MADQTTQSACQPRRYLSPQEFGRLSGLSLATVRRYLRLGCLPYRQPAGPRGRILIPDDALEAIAGVPTDRATTAAASPAACLGEPSSSTATRLPGPRPRWIRKTRSSQEQEA
jgi:hypothetical protein